jgi:hypothetical protein
MTAPVPTTSSIVPFTVNAGDIELRVRGEYREMPGMRLTVEQAMRMWLLDRETCQHVLNTLVAAHYLERDENGRYARCHGGY